MDAGPVEVVERDGTAPEGDGGGRTRDLPLGSGRRFSLAGKIVAGFFSVVIVVAGIAVGATLLALDRLSIFLLILLVSLPLGAWLIGRLTRPLDMVIRGVADGIRSFRDRDFSVRLAYRRNDELGDLVELYNAVGEILLEERRSLTQRELLLRTALERSPAGIVLFNSLGRVIYSNREARRLFTAGARLAGMSLAELEAGCPPEMRQLLASGSEGLFSVTEDEGATETYHLSQRLFTLNRQRHRLLMLRRMTGELSRQEAETWKKVIRVISHELNNSLAPISSLVHSAKVITSEPRHAERSAEVFETLRERLDHLKGFIDGYARFARLPRPRYERVDWAEFLKGFAEYPMVRFPDSLPTAPGWFDPAQMRQVLINLFKNAVEASEDEPRIDLRIGSGPEGELLLQVTDEGCGMDEETLEKALLPFYSTKKTGSGLGLALCREILEGHGGRLSLESGLDAGTTVTCWLPAPPEDLAPIAGEPAGRT